MKSIRIDDDDGDDCRTLRGGGHYIRKPLQVVGGDANCLVQEGRPIFGFRVVYDVGLAVPPGRPNRGSMHVEGEAYVSTGGTEEELPHNWHWSIGIRLAKEST